MLKQMMCGMVLLSGIASVQAAEPVSLLDKELSNFEVWMGIPHTSVEGLPEGTFQSDTVKKGTPLGLNNDPKKVYSVIEEDGEPVLKITGEIYGGLTSIKEYENYHLSMKMKWGDKKWEPRLDRLRDSGLLYHCHGKHGAMWGVWKASLELQVQETDLGDFYSIAGTGCEIRGTKLDAKNIRFDPASEKYYRRGGRGHAFPEPDAPLGEWNLIELYTLGQTAVHVVNGQIVMVLENTVKKDKTPLTKGQFQIQSEGAECYYKAIRIRPITDFPESIKKQLRLK